MAYVPLQISIPEPCSEAWSGMTPVTDNSRHCDSCDKEVTDFSFMTDAQIGRTLTANGGRICGRFRADQLNRPLFLNGPRRRRGLGPVAAAASMLLAAPVFAQTPQPVAIEQVDVENKQGNTSLPVEKFRFYGQVTSADDGESLIGASIQIEGTTIGTIADLDGNFNLLLSTEKEIRLVISYTGFASEVIVYSPEELLQMARTEGQSMSTVRMTLDSNEWFLGGSIVISYSYRKSNSLLDNLLVHKVDPIVIDRPLGPAKGDWKAYWRELFAEKKARRAARKLERQAAKAERMLARAAEPVPEAIAPPAGKTLSSVPAFFLKASPNPFSTEITASFTLPEAGAVRITLMDTNGRTLKVWKHVAQAGAQSFRLDNLPGKLPAGSYYLRLRNERGEAETITVVR